MTCPGDLYQSELEFWSSLVIDRFSGSCSRVSTRSVLSRRRLPECKYKAGSLRLAKSSSTGPRVLWVAAQLSLRQFEMFPELGEAATVGRPDHGAKPPPQVMGGQNRVRRRMKLPKSGMGREIKPCS